MKINTLFVTNILFLWVGKSRNEDKYIPSSSNRHKTLTMVSLQTGNISPTLSSTILGC
jgi:hypothetical protein